MYISTDDMDADQEALLKRLEADGTVLESTGSVEGYGHHSTAYVVEMLGLFYSAESSGCSCQGNGTIEGPFATIEEARESLTEYHRNDLKPGDNT
jgi:hypothetical protein